MNGVHSSAGVGSGNLEQRTLQHRALTLSRWNQSAAAFHPQAFGEFRPPLADKRGWKGAICKESITRHRWQPRYVFWAGVLLAALLTGCQAPQPTPDAKTAVSPPPSAPDPSAKISAAQTSSVLGLQPRELQKMLGLPKLVRRDAPAEIWQYRSEACVLDVFIYRVAAGARVKYAEARTIQAEPAKTDDCVKAIRQQNSPDRLPT